MASFVSIAATDTGVGKTLVTTALARGLVSRKNDVLAIKLVESGCSDATRADEDGVRLAEATGQPAPKEALVRLSAPLTPALAAERENVQIDMDALERTVRALAATASIVLIESAGGLASPITWTEDAATVATRFGAATVLVAPDRLGCLSHVLLAVRALVAAKLPLVAVVLSAPAERDASTGTNALALTRVLGADVPIVELPRVTDAADAVSQLEAVLDRIERGAARIDAALVR